MDLLQFLLVVRVLRRYGLIPFSNCANLRIFVCLAYAHMYKDKLEPRSRKCIFLGYADEVKRYRLWYSDSKSSKFLIGKDATFNKFVILSPKKEHFDAKKQPVCERKCGVCV